MNIIMVLKKLKGGVNLVYVLVKCLSRIGIKDVNLSVDILRLSWICCLGSAYCNSMLMHTKRNICAIIKRNPS